MSRRPLAFAAILVSASALAAAQAPVLRQPSAGRPPRSLPAVSEGTAMLRGVVVGGESGQPLRRAVVRLFGGDLPEGRVATTDEQGRWELRDLPAGRFNLSAMKAGYVSLQFGQRRPFERGRPIEVADGQTIEGIQFNLPRGSVISGRILDEFGEPVAETMVAAMRYRYINGRRRLVPAGRFSQTDDLGQFRIYGLPPGEYYLSATLRGPMMCGMTSESRTGYAPTYYPGTGSPQQAERLTVGVGAELSGVTFSLLPVRTVRISGTALDSEGRPMTGAFVAVMEAGESAEGGFMMVGGGTRVRDDGSFTLTNVAPGEYLLQAGAFGPPRPGSEEVAFTRLSVGSEDLTGVVLAARRPALLTGQIVFDVPPPATVRPGAVTLAATPKEILGPMMLMAGGAARVNDDWTFELRSSMSPVVIRTPQTPPGYILKSALVNGQDVADTGLSFQSGETIRDIQVVLTTRKTTLTGTVRDSRGQPAADYSVVVFAEDRALWGHLSRYHGMARPDQQGAFRLEALPPGRYLAAAVEYLEDGEQADPEMLERLRPLATPVTLVEGEQQQVTLDLVQAY